MKTTLCLGAVLTGALLFVAGHITARTNNRLSQKTPGNLSTAMHGEAFAYAKYLLYAKQAKQNGNTELADLFTKAANTERFQTMYREFVEQAKAAGDTAAADRFEEVRHDEMARRDAFQAALKKISSHAAGDH
jgi:rubrerythrin